MALYKDDLYEAYFNRLAIMMYESGSGADFREKVIAVTKYNQELMEEIDRQEEEWKKKHEEK